MSVLAQESTPTQYCKTFFSYYFMLWKELLKIMSKKII